MVYKTYVTFNGTAKDLSEKKSPLDFEITSKE